MRNLPAATTCHSDQINSVSFDIPLNAVYLRARKAGEIYGVFRTLAFCGGTDGRYPDGAPNSVPSFSSIKDVRWPDITWAVENKRSSGGTSGPLSSQTVYSCMSEE